MHLNSPDNGIFFSFSVSRRNFSARPPVSDFDRGRRKKCPRYRQETENIIIDQRDCRAFVRVRRMFMQSLRRTFHAIALCVCDCVNSSNKPQIWWKWKWFEAHWVEKIVICMAQGARPSRSAAAHRANSLFRILFFLIWIFFGVALFAEFALPRIFSCIWINTKHVINQNAFDVRHTSRWRFEASAKKSYSDFLSFAAA